MRVGLITDTHIPDVAKTQAAEKRLTSDSSERVRVTCGANTSHLSDGEWIDDNAPVTICQMRVSPSDSVRPNGRDGGAGQDTGQGP